MSLDWKFDQKTAGLTFLAIAAYQSSRGSSLPSLYEMQKEEDSSIPAARVAQIKAITDGAILGIGAAFVSDSLWPLVGVGAMVLIDAIFYGYASGVHVEGKMAIEVDD